MGEVKNTGRLLYIEPTNIGNDKRIGLGEEISFPYEDYCMSVDLTIRIVDRYSCGWGVQTGDIKEYVYSSSDESISFLGGSKVGNLEGGYLTTNFTDISMTSPGNNTSECLGIESINITYDSWMHPLVTVKFVDVRGASVMQPSEAGYYNKADLGNSKHLYRALFTMPYPMFILKVKGYYGKGATFKLAPHKTDFEFDSETGNFNITVAFIGYMYGVYADIPMTYLAAAPYMPGGKEYWAEKVADGTFKFRDISGQPRQDMLKIPDLRLRVAQAAANEEAISAAKEGERVKTTQEERIAALRGLGDSYPFKAEDWLISDSLKYSYTICDSEDGVKELRTNIFNYYKSVGDYDTAYGKTYQKLFSSIKKYENYVLIAFSLPYDGKNDIPKTTYKGYNTDYLVRNYGIEVDNEKVKNFIASKKKNNDFYLVFMTLGDINGQKNQFLNNITMEVKDIEEKTKKDIERYKQQEMEIVEKVIGFRPSVRNVFELIFAHMETFMHCFYGTTKIIRDQLDGNHNARRKSYYGISDEDTDTARSGIDIGGDTKKSSLLPPYAAFYDKIPSSDGGNRKEMVWPGIKTSKANELEEVNFVTDLLAGAEMYMERAEAVEQSLSAITAGNAQGDSSTVVGEGVPNTDIRGFIPITTYDFVYKDRIENPYNSIKSLLVNESKESKTNIAGLIMATFAIRAFYHLSNSVDYTTQGGYATTQVQTTANYADAKTFGTIEAINLFKSVGDNISKDFYNFIIKYADGKDTNADTNEFITALTSFETNDITKVWKFDKDINLFKTDGINMFYTYHNPSGGTQDIMLPLGLFNINDIKNALTNDLTNDTRFISTTSPANINLDEAEGSNSFTHFEVRDYINTIATAVEQEFTSTKEYLENNKEGYGNRKADEYGDISRANFVLKNYEKINKGLLDDSDKFYDRNTIVKFDDSTVNKGEANNILASASFSGESEYFIKYPSKIDESEDISLFGHKIYEINNENGVETKAYLFLQSLPIRKVGKTGNIVGENSNGIIPRSLLLREGSYYWYLENYDKVYGYESYENKDGEIVKNILFKTPRIEPKETFVGDKFKNSYESMNPLSITSDIDYLTWDYPKNCTPSRKKYLKEYFVKWANANSRIFELLENKELYNDKNLNAGLNIKNLAGDSSKQGQLAEMARELQVLLRDLFFSVDTIFDLYNDLRTKNGVITCKKESLSIAFKEFMHELKLIYGKQIDDAKGAANAHEYVRSKSIEARAKNPFKNDDLRLATYMTLKSLYDKWLCAPQYGPLETWVLNRKQQGKGDFNNFIYTDSYYHDIGDLFTVNITKISSWLSSCLPTGNLESTEGILAYTGKSIYNFLTEVAQDSGAILLAIPQRFGAYDYTRVEEMFKPIPIYGDWNTDESSFVFMYTYKPSEHLGDNGDGDCEGLDMNGFSPKGDGFNLVDSEIVGSIMGGNGYNIPAFGVTYAKQNQSIFRNIRLSSADAGVTEVSLASTFNVASKASESPREAILYGQDIYKTYSQMAFKCSAEMMGNAQITPLMFFQLNNIPFWKGAYQILKVTHDITAGNFVTRFEGIRTNRHSIPLTTSAAFTIKDAGTISQDSGENNVVNGQTSQSVSSDGNIVTNVGANPNLATLNTIDFYESNISESKPLICLTPAHGPKTFKKLEWMWSSKVVDRMVEILKEYTYSDGTPYNIQRCNKGGNHTGKGYSMKETKRLIEKYGSKNVISVVPHWNGGGGTRYEIYLDRTGRVREDSMKLAECMKSEVINVINEVQNSTVIINGQNILSEGEVGTKLRDGIKNTINVLSLPESNTDGAPQLNCACILTENWYSDYKSDGKGPSCWESGKLDSLMYNWFNNNTGVGLMNGVETIAQMHAKAIKRYIDSLT